MSSQFVWGVAVGVAGVYLFHRFVMPIPGGKGG